MNAANLIERGDFDDGQTYDTNLRDRWSIGPSKIHFSSLKRQKITPWTSPILIAAFDVSMRADTQGIAFFSFIFFVSIGRNVLFRKVRRSQEKVKRIRHKAR